MAHNKSNRCVQCNTIIIYSRKDEFKNLKRNDDSYIIGDINECNMEAINFHIKEKTIKCKCISENVFISKHNAVGKTCKMCGNTKFPNSAAVGDRDTNCNILATESPVVMKTFPFSCYKNLKHLILNGAEIDSLPENISALNNLYSLDLSNNYLTDLPRSFADLHKLRLLNISNNKFTELPPCLLTGLQILKYLNISNNIIKSLDNPPLCLPFLQTLILSSVMLIELPVWFWNRNCHLLIHLNLSGNMCFSNCNYINHIKELHYMYPSITKNVTSLDISNCGFTSIWFLNEFKNITFLNIGNSKVLLRNSLLELPMSVFADPSKLVELHVDDVGLALLPKKINLFTNLKVLNAPNNSLSWLPDNFDQLHSLEVLNLKSNKLVLLTNGFRRLIHLKKLYLSRNHLTRVKEDIEELINLEVLDLYNNYISEIPISEKHFSKLKSFDMECNKIDSSIIQEASLVVGSDYAKLRQTLRENLTEHRYDGMRIDSSSSFSEPEDDGNSEISHVKNEIKDEENSHAGYSGVHEDNCSGCETDLNNEVEEPDWEEEEYWDVHDSDEEWDPSTHSRQEAHVQWKTSDFYTKSFAVLNNTYCPAEDHVPTCLIGYRKNCSPALENQFDD